MDCSWWLSRDGRTLLIYKLDPVTRELTLLVPLSRRKPMTREEAKKYVDANYPRNGSAVQLAAEALGMRKKP